VNQYPQALFLPPANAILSGFVFEILHPRIGTRNFNSELTFYGFYKVKVA